MKIFNQLRNMIVGRKQRVSGVSPAAGRRSGQVQTEKPASVTSVHNGLKETEDGLDRIIIPTPISPILLWLCDKEELIQSLSSKLPDELVNDLVNNFLQIKQDVATETLERSSPGKFVETVVQVLQFIDEKKYEKGWKEYYFKPMKKFFKNKWSF